MAEEVGGNESVSPRVSIVIPAYNEQREIILAMQQMDNQTYRDREIIVVDDGSNDETYVTAVKYANGTKDTKVIRTEHNGPSHARNAGVARSKGEIIFFGECDCVYDNDYLEKAIKSLDANPKAGAVCLTGGPLVARQTIATESIQLENVVQHTLLKQGKTKPFYAWVYRREALEKVGGFDERLFQAEDRDLFSRVKEAGYEIAWVPGISWRHKREETTTELASKWFKRGRTRVLFSLKHRLFFEMAKTILPFWIFVLGVILLPIYAIVGSVLILLVILVLLVQSLRMIRIAWPGVTRKSSVLGYPVFLATRNFSSALGYTYGLVNVLIRKVQRKEISHSNV